MGGLQDRSQPAWGIPKQGLGQPQAESFSTLWLLLAASAPARAGTPKGAIQGTKTQPFLKGFLSRTHTWIPSVSHQPQGWRLLFLPPSAQMSK